MESTSLRTFVGSVLCIDIVGYSKLPDDQQIAVKKRFNARLVSALQRVSSKDRVALDTGDGALIGFLGDPEQCFAVALRLRDAMEPGTVRLGIHLGSVKIVPGVSGAARLVGDAVNVAERVMSFAQPGQVAVSRAFHSVASHLSQKHEALFRHLGLQIDKQGQQHDIFVIDPPQRVRLPKPALLGGIAAAALVVLGAGTWFLMRKPAAPPPPPLEVATKEETYSYVPAEIPREGTVRQQRSSSAPAPSQSSGSGILGDGQRLLSSVTRGATDAARSIGSSAQSAISTVKDKTMGTTHAAAPLPTVLSRAPVAFPPEAASQGLVYGRVRGRMDIDAAGNVAHVAIVSADPPGYFEKAAVSSLRRWKFNAGSDGRSYETDVEFRR